MSAKYAVFARFRDETAARAALDGLDQNSIPRDHIIVRACEGDRGAESIAHALMNSGASAESDGSRGIRIGLVLGGLLGAAMGGGMFMIFGMPTAIGTLLGVMMGAFIGALMSGIVGAGLINNNLKRVLASIEAGQTLVTVLARGREEQRRVHDRLRDGSEETAINR